MSLSCSKLAFQATRVPEEDSRRCGALRAVRQADQVRQVGVEVPRLHGRLPHRVQAAGPHALRRKRH